MGLLDRIRRPEQAPAATLPTEGLGGAATKLVERLIAVGIEGVPPFASATEVARAALDKKGPPERAIDQVVTDHLKAVAASGFVTGLGGFVTLPVAMPANVAGFYLTATRMTAAIASLRGYDVTRPEVRSAILLALVGADSEDVLRKAGFANPAGRLSSLATSQLPGPLLMAANKGVGFRLLTQFGTRSLSRLGRAVPIAGGLLGAGYDGYLLKKIADHVRDEFPRQG